MSEPDSKPPWWNRPLFQTLGNKWWNQPLYQTKSDRLGIEVSRAIDFTIGIQVLVLILAGMILDGGFCFQVAVLAAAAWWLAAICIVSRRPMTSSRAELLFLRIGFVLLLPISLFSSPCWGWLRELLKWN